MDLFKYFKPVTKPTLPKEVSLLTEKELCDVNAKVKATIAKEAKSRKGKKYNNYTPEQRASIRRYAAEHGPVRALQYFSKTMDIELPETTARRFKKEYLKEILVPVKLLAWGCRQLRHCQPKIKAGHCFKGSKSIKLFKNT